MKESRDLRTEVGLRDTMREAVPQSLYVHIPFCASRCFYCDFTTYVAPKGAVEGYVANLEQEFSMVQPRATAPLQTVFFGGGTPTLLSSKQLERMLQALRASFQVAEGAEITMEANPGTVDPEKLQVMATHGVNRISFGAQSFNDRLLMAIGRLHDADAVKQGVLMAKQAGFQRINVDLMFGLPEQSLADVRASLEELMRLDVEHISAYWLKVEAGTPFAKWQTQGVLPLPGEDAEADMYEFVRTFLAKEGYVHYEVSNFARAGGEALHNLVYWRNLPYWAAGVAAHGYAFGQRTANVSSLTEYHRLIEEGVPPVSEATLISLEEAVEDTMMLGLRLREGVSQTDFVARHGIAMEEVFGEMISKLFQQGLLEWHDDRLRLSERAWPVANVVFEEFVGTLT